MRADPDPLTGHIAQHRVQRDAVSSRRKADRPKRARHRRSTIARAPRPSFPRRRRRAPRECPRTRALRTRDGSDCWPVSRRPAPGDRRARGPLSCQFRRRVMFEFSRLSGRWPIDLDRCSGTEQTGADSEEQTIQFRHEQAGPRARLGGHPLAGVGNSRHRAGTPRSRRCRN